MNKHYTQLAGNLRQKYIKLLGKIFLFTGVKLHDTDPLFYCGKKLYERRKLNQ